MRLEALLGDVRDPANPYGRAALWAGGYDALPAAPAVLPGAGDLPGADQLARALGPLFRRDLALAHAWSIRPLSSAPVPHPAAALLGPAALLAATGSVLRAVTRIVDGLSRYETAARQWRPVLATVFAELLACQSLTRAALRACPAPGRDGPPAPYRAEGDGELLAAVAGYLVPQLALELLGDLELVLNECGFDSHTVERRALARTVRNRAFAGAGPAATGAAQARIVRRLNETGGGPGQDTPPHGTGTDPAPAPGTDPAPAPGTDPAPAPGADPSPVPGTGSAQDTTTAMTPAVGAAWPPPAAGTDAAAADGTAGAQVPVMPSAAAGRASPQTAATPSAVADTGVIGVGADTGTAPDTGTAADSGAAVGDAGVVALARIGRRLAVERRALRGAWAAGAVHDPADPAARALADRQALLVLADRTTAVREQAARADRSFLGGTGWALLALGRITVRLGLLVPACVPDVRAHVWDELARRAAGGADCDPDCDPDDLTGLPW
ncbi:hypothetical protein AB0F46_18855 [Streptomyces sp. NPDC026665]|uniref:hypothetical protein n=1 Tax=Streptomyces sp. NPDC026665 TaxID=3154798 RepID=UPI0033D3A983